MTFYRGQIFEHFMDVLLDGHTWLWVYAAVFDVCCVTPSKFPHQNWSSPRWVRETWYVGAQITQCKLKNVTVLIHLHEFCDVF